MGKTRAEEYADSELEAGAQWDELRGVIKKAHESGFRAAIEEAEKLRRDYGGVYVDVVSVLELRKLLQPAESEEAD